MHYIDQRKKGKEVFMAIKFNMSKAYNRVEWVYLEAMMRKMGFHERWIHLIMMCVTTVVMTQEKALAISALYLKRTSHN